MEMLIFYVELVHELSPLINMSSIKLSYVVYVGQDPNKKLLVVNRTKTPKPDNWRGKPTRDDDVIMHLCALGDPLGRGGKGGEGDSQDHTLCQVA